MRLVYSDVRPLASAYLQPEWKHKYFPIDTFNVPLKTELIVTFNTEITLKWWCTEGNVCVSL